MEKDPKDEGLDRLFAEARRAGFYRPGAEYGFEARVAANIRAQREGRPAFFLWAWRLIPVFATIVIFIGIWLFTSQQNQQIDLSAVSNIGNEETMVTAYLTGE